MTKNELSVVLIAVPLEKRQELETARDRYMYFAGVYTDRPVDDHVAEDRTKFPHLLEYSADGRPSISDERCAEFMASVSGLPYDWCFAWDTAAFRGWDWHHFST